MFVLMRATPLIGMNRWMGRRRILSMRCGSCTDGDLKVSGARLADASRAVICSMHHALAWACLTEGGIRARLSDSDRDRIAAASSVGLGRGPEAKAAVQAVWLWNHADLR